MISPVATTASAVTAPHWLCQNGMNSHPTAVINVPRITALNAGILRVSALIATVKKITISGSVMRMYSVFADAST